LVIEISLYYDAQSKKNKNNSSLEFASVLLFCHKRRLGAIYKKKLQMLLPILIYFPSRLFYIYQNRRSVSSVHISLLG